MSARGSQKKAPQERSIATPSSASPTEGSSLLPKTTPYTIFTTHQKRLLTLLVGLATITSPLTATIYFPLLPLLATHFHTSAQAINQTITLYIVFQAISPAVFATLSDSLGRRAIYLVTLLLYTLANLGLALNKDSYAMLLVLRCVQSLGASAAYAISYGVVADVCVPAERGSMVGPVSMALNLGACIGPIVGGWVAFRSGGYGGVFWFLVTVGAVLVLAVGILLPETARNRVGNRTVFVERWWEKTWLSLLIRWIVRRRSDKQSRRSAQDTDHGVGEDTAANTSDLTDHEVKMSKIQNPFNCLRMLIYKDSFLVLWMHGLFYMVDYCVQTTIPSTYKDIYHFNAFEIGLAYLPRGVGIIAGGYFNGKMMDRNYRVTAGQIGHTVDRVSGDDLDHFPIERARSRGSWYLLAASTCALIGYGWAIDRRTHVSVTLVLQFILGFLGTCFYTIYNTLLVDIFPDSPSTAAAAASVTRCALAASGVAVVAPLIDLLGKGWYFTALGLLSGVAGSMTVWTLQNRGMQWRGERLAKTESLAVDEQSEHSGPQERDFNSTTENESSSPRNSRRAGGLNQKAKVRS